MKWTRHRAKQVIGLSAALLVAVAVAAAQSGWQARPDIAAAAAKARPASNFDEAKVGPVALPDPLVSRGGTVRTPEAWRPRRAEILELFRDHVYGRSPGL